MSLWIREKQRSLTDWLLESLKAWSHGILASLYWDARLQLFPGILSQSGCGSGQSLLLHSVSWKSSWSSNSSLAVFPERKKISYVTWEVQQIPCCLPTLDFSLTLKKKKKTIFFPKKKWHTFFLFFWKYSRKKCEHTMYRIYIICYIQCIINKHIWEQWRGHMNICPCLCLGRRQTRAIGKWPFIKVKGENLCWDEVLIFNWPC